MKIGIKGLKVSCIIGVLPHERKRKQTLSIDLEVQIEKKDLKDEIQNTFDYRLLQSICQKIGNKELQLIETFAEEVLIEVLKSPEILHAKCTVQKKSAIKLADFVYVALERSKR